jgi:hypothetical protein
MNLCGGNDVPNKFPSNNFGTRWSTSFDQSAKIIKSFGTDGVKTE